MLHFVYLPKLELWLNLTIVAVFEGWCVKLTNGRELSVYHTEDRDALTNALKLASQSVLFIPENPNEPPQLIGK